MRPFKWVYDWFRADTAGDRLPFAKENANSILTFLTTFSLGQGLVFAQAMQGRGNRFWVLAGPMAFYFFVFLLTVLALWAVVFRKDATPTGPEWVYDRGSIVFGRWSVLVAFLSLFLLCILAGFGAIPGQAHRLKYPGEYIHTTPLSFSDRAAIYTNPFPSDSPSEKDAKAMGNWIQMISGVVDKPQSPLKDGGVGFAQRVVWIEQDIPFRENYVSFVATVYVDKNYKVDDAFAFLVKKHDKEGYARPTYRQMVPLPDHTTSDKYNPQQFWIFEPSADEGLVILAVITRRNGEPIALGPEELRRFDIRVRASSE